MANHEWESEPSEDGLSEDGLSADDRWLDQRLASLGPDRDWAPDAGRTLARLRARTLAKTRARGLAVRRWVWTTVVAASACAALLVLPASRACAEQPGPCVQRVFGRAANPTIVSVSTAPTVPAAPAVVDRVVTRPSIQSNFKDVGFASAPIGIEIYIDYECPHCEAFVRDVVPLLTAQYVQTGKARLLYRDFPLPSHRYAKAAAEYADAAGELGYYDAAMRQLFATRSEWSANGEVEKQVARVLPASVMEKLRERIEGDTNPGDALAADLAAGQADHLDRVPFVVLVSGDMRQAVEDAALSFDVLKGNLDQILIRDHGNMTIDETSDCRRRIQSHVPCAPR